MRVLTVLALVVGWALGQEEYGPLVTSSIHSEVAGSVHVVNKNTLQLVGFRVKRKQLKVRLQLVDQTGQAVDYEALYHRKATQNGDEFLRPINLGSAKLIPSRSRGLNLVVRFANNIRVFRTLRLSDASGKELARVSLAGVPVPSSAPLPAGRSFDNPAHIPYKSHGDAIYAVNQRSFLITNFEFDGRRPPDGWIYGSKRKFSKRASDGLRLKMEGRDVGFGARGKNLHCAMTDHVKAARLTVTLPPGQSVCSIRFLGVYCYAYGEDFGHTGLRMAPAECARLQPYLPPVRAGPLALPSPNCKAKQRRDGKGAAAVDNWDYYGQ